MNIAEIVKNASLVKKISVAEVIGNVKTLVKKYDSGTRVPLMRCFGNANGIKTGESDYGEWIAYTGDFVGIDLTTDGNPAFRASKIFLPEIASGIVHNVMLSSEASNIQFGFDIIAVVDDESTTGYVYTVEALMDMGENDPMLLLGKTIGTKALPSLNTAALPAPKKGGKKRDDA